MCISSLCFSLDEGLRVPGQCKCKCVRDCSSSSLMAKAEDVDCSDDSVTCSTNNQSEIEAWEYNPSDEDQRLPHKFSPNRPIPLAHVHGLGVLTWKLNVDNWENDPLLEKIKKERGYNYAETKTVSPAAMEDYEDKIKMFFQEHMHSQEEIRLILDGEGYWDIRDYDDKWIRFRVQKGDLIVLPPGMFHRFTLDVTNYIKALLLYTEVPCRTQHGRSEDAESNARKKYIEDFLSHQLQLMNLNLKSVDNNPTTKEFEVSASIEVSAQ